MFDFIGTHTIALGYLSCAVMGAMLLAPYRNKMCIALIVVLPCLIVPRRLGEDPAAYTQSHAGIAPATPAIYTSVCVLAILVAISPWSRRQSVHALTGLLLLAALAAAVVWVWGSTAVHWSGYLTWVTVLIGWLGGLAMGRQAASHLTIRRCLTWLLAMLIFVELTVSALQVLDVVTIPFMVQASDEGLQRARGTFGHAGDLGKVLVGAVAILLPNLAQRGSRDVVLLTYGAILSSFVCIGLTASRSNILAITILIVAWTVLSTSKFSRGSGKRLLAWGLLGCIPFAGTYLLRFQEDPRGGSRTELYAAALQQLSRSPLWGTGPNSYVEVVGRYDAATARGLPVHNAFLLVAAEVGLPLFMLSMVIATVLTVRMIRLHFASRANAYTGAYLALGCALIVINVTGWGALKITVLPTLVFAGGFLLSAAYIGRAGALEAKNASGPEKVVNPEARQLVARDC